MKKKISVIVPVFNEEKTVGAIINKLLAVDFGCEKEILVIDDFSSDGTEKIVKKIASENKIVKFYKQKKNIGKGAAIRKGLNMANGDVVAFQDADSEYDVRDLVKLVKIVLEGKSEVVYGSRFLGKKRIGQISFYLGNRFLSFVTSLFYFKKITDMETCYKVFKLDVLKGVELKSNRFDIEPEITSKILRKGFDIKEVEISYKPRKIEDGKKINWRDGVFALWALIRYRYAD